MSEAKQEAAAWLTEQWTAKLAGSIEMMTEVRPGLKIGSLSERLATHNGILLIGSAAMAALWATGGNVSALVVMYSINVFLTFSLSMIGMARHWYEQRGKNPLWRRRWLLFVFGATLCLCILGVNLYYKVIYDLYHLLTTRPMSRRG